MKELLRTTDAARLSWLTALLADAGIRSFVLDTHASFAEGSIGALQRRLAVASDDYEKARRVLIDSGEELPDDGR